MAMKTFFTITFILTFFNGFVYAQTNNNRMINMLHTGNYFEIKDYDACLRTWGDTLDSFNSLFYKYNIANFENKPDSAAFYLEDLLTRGEFGADTFDFYFRLWSLYAKTLHNYKKALLTCDKVEIYLKENPHNIPQEALLEWNEYVSGWKKQTRQWGTEPVIKIVRDNINDTAPIFKENPNLLYFGAEYNDGNRLKTLFDTGMTEFFSMDEEMAQEIGVRKSSYDNDSITTVNGVQARGYIGILDSVQIANIKLYNIPVNVLNVNSLIDQLSDSQSIDSMNIKVVKDLHKSSRITMGLKAMLLIRRIVINWKEMVLRFPLDKEKTHTNSKANLFLFSDKLFARIKVNHIPLTAFVDIGDATEGMYIDSWFYEKNKEKIFINKSTKKEALNTVRIHSICTNIHHETVRCPSIMLENRKMKIKKDKVYIHSLVEWALYPNFTEGIIGYNFFKNLGKEILFDFNNMRIDVLR